MRETEKATKAMTALLSPLGPRIIPNPVPALRAALRDDLEARMARAWDYVEEADAAGNLVRARRALEKAYLRQFQIEHLDAMPAVSWCLLCQREPLAPEDFGAEPEYMCVEHMAPALADRAAAYAEDVYAERELRAVFDAQRAAGGSMTAAAMAVSRAARKEER